MIGIGKPTSANPVSSKKNPTIGDNANIQMIRLLAGATVCSGGASGSKLDSGCCFMPLFVGLPPSTSGGQLMNVADSAICYLDGPRSPSPLNEPSTSMFFSFGTVAKQYQNGMHSKINITILLLTCKSDSFSSSLNREMTNPI